uniref:Protein translocase subunit SecY n=1 Tax=Halamphora coffeiformis TaxID=1487565 RepID=A0A516ZBT1_9STRA|nr:preprotein translocase subunit secY [Halamphora coffeaeformis]QDR25174.1 preprotein translocase subunit secY [Halamphora coffeaeformis]
MKINKEIRTILLNRFLITFGIILFIRLGTFLPVPGVNHSDLAFYIQTHSVARNLISTFSGDNTFVIGLFTLNIFPYINASILIQLILGFSPKLAKLQKEGDLEGRRSINRLTRLITLIWAVIQSIGLTLYLRQILFDWNYVLAFEIIVWLTTGAMIVLWLSEIITDYGLGNGASLLIYINIISNLPNLSKTIISENLTIFSTLGFILLIFGSLYGIVFLQEGVRIIPLISSKQLTQGSGQDSLISTNYIPLRFNQAGVMPIILTTAILVVPNYINSLGLFPQVNLPINIESLSFLYWIGYFGFILLFSSFYSTIVLNPKDISDQLQKMAVTIPGIRPGIQTTFYLKQVMKRITLVGATMLATLVTIPNFIESTLSITSLNGLSTTSLLILAGVVLDLVREVKNIYFANIYNNM